MTHARYDVRHSSVGPVGRTLAGVALALPMVVIVSLKPRTGLAQSAGDVTILIAALVAVAGCFAAARRGGSDARGWRMMGVAAATWASGQLIYTVFGLTRDHVYPFPSLADIGFIGHAIPAAIALMLFPRTPQRGVSRFRVVLDALVIASSLLLSWVTVLGPLADTAGSGLTQVASLGYPIPDIFVASLVLALGMRVPPGARRPWLVLGVGLLLLAATDNIYVVLLARGDTGLTGTPLAIGWALAFLLMAAASQLPVKQSAASARHHFTVVQELLPYLPLVAALVVTHDRRFDASEPFLLASGAAVVTLFAAQQVLIAIEKVGLANGLERKIAERTAEASSADERVRSLIKFSDDAIVTKSPHGIIMSWNPAAERIYGFSADEIVGKSTDTFIPEPLQAEERATHAALRAGETVPNYETERRRKDGSIIAVSVTASPIYVDGEVAGISAISHDISDRKQHEAELASARLSALAASRAKSEFLATMSHEIRTPMNGVIGLTQLLLDTRLDQVQRRYAAGVRGAGEALLAIIDDILDFSKLEAGRVELEDHDYDPRQLVEEVGLLLASTAAAKRIELVAYCDQDVPEALSGDAGRLRQILLNLASNALKFTSDGEVVLRLRLAPAQGAREELEFSVSDTGIGIAADDQERMFEPFSQADASTTRRFGGTGLGLAICRRLVEAMGGQLGIDSELGSGSTFRFRVPMVERPAIAVRRAPLPGLLQNLPVLVVDDNETNRLILSTQLTAWGMRPVLASDGPNGLRLLQEAARAGTPYGIVILDLCMPGMDGLQVARMIAADTSLEATRMMMLSSAGPIDGADASAAGILACIDKPVRQSELHDSLVQLADPAAAKSAPLPLALPKTSGAVGGRVLVVEDNHVNQMVAEGVLRKLGYAVEVAANGVQGLAAMRTGTFDAVLMDCHMPEMDGFEATIAWRRDEGADQRLPIIAMTAGVLAADRQRCLEAGMDDFVAKPIDMDVLARALSSSLSIRGTSSGRRRAAALSSASPTSADGPCPVDAARLDLLRGMGPTDGWGLLPLVVAAFLAEIPQQQAAIRAAADGADPAAMMTAAHKLKGSAANLGATAVAAICGHLEATAGRGAASELIDSVDQLDREVERAGSALAELLASRS